MAILTNVKRRIIVNAGHYDKDSGAISAVERDEVRKIRDEVLHLLAPLGFEVFAVPDNLDLAKSIAYVNEKANSLNEGLCIDIHLNSFSNKSVRGTEAYYLTSDTSTKIAERMAFHVSDQLGIPNRGAKSDTLAAAGSLAWLRKTKPWATLVEVCFISNEADMKALTGTGGYKRAAQGIVNAVSELYGVKTGKTIPESISIIEEELSNIKKQI